MQGTFVTQLAVGVSSRCFAGRSLAAHWYWEEHRSRPSASYGILRALLDRLNLRPFLQVAGMGRDGDIRHAEEVFPEYLGHFEAVEMLQPSLRQKPLNSPPQSVVSAKRRNYRPDYTGHEEQVPAHGADFLIES